ncbi:hypothetical protein AYK24_02895 [Thermoplasmatales archaeon SG8-52-4]|nr:MAG: hypothetical protein AYK24_02895 [Thermoplasmatales archaeon SG8-52-4]
MPGVDGTGPQGRGPMTGRSAGFCAGFSSPGYANPEPARGFGRGIGRGFGRGYWGRRMFWRGYYDPPYQRNFPTQSKEEEKNYLENMVKGLEEEIKDIRTRIKQLSEEK